MTRADQVQVLQKLITLCTHPKALDVPSDAAARGEILLLALDHGVAPLLYLCLKGCSLPDSERMQLRALYTANAIRNERLLTEQRRLLAAFSEKSIPVWPLKGPHLGEQLYGDAAVRQVADLDLLTGPDNFVASDAVLQSLGYVRQTQGDIALLRHAGELIYIRSVRGIAETINLAVDLQQRVLPYGRRDPLADRIRALGMTPENLLLLLCVNQVAHRFARLKYLLDVSACLRALPESFNWESFIAAARQLEFTPGIYWGLVLARDTAAAPVPDSVLSALRPGPFTQHLLARSLGANALVTLTRGATLDGPAGAWAILACTRSGFARARQLLRIVFPPPATLRQEFFATPGRSILSLYFLRLARKLPAAFRR